MSRRKLIILFLAVYAVTTPVVIAVLSALGGRAETSVSAGGYFSPVLRLAGAVFTRERVPDYETEIKPILSQYCYDCHADGANKGGIALDAHPDSAALVADKTLWIRVLENLQSGIMPPPGKAQPTLADKARFEAWLDGAVFHHNCDDPDPGRVTIRRLNRVEYNNTIRDLTGVAFRPADDFPADDTGYGFDNIGDVLSLSPVLLEKYLKAAERILAEALPIGPDRGSTMILRAKDLNQTGGGGARDGDSRTLASSGEVYGQPRLAEAGEYLIRIHASGDQAGSEPARMEVRIDGKTVQRVDVPQKPAQPGQFDFTVKFSAGQHRVGAFFINDYYNPAARQDRNLHVGPIEVTGPAKTRARTPFQLATFRQPVAPADEAKAAHDIIRQFARRAFRRPVAEAEVERYVPLVKLAQKNGESFEAGVRLAFQAILVSPHFLFRGEVQPQPDNPKSVHPVDDFALASRLSYFLWSSMPDDELLQLAEAGSLRKHAAAQTRRMLASPKSRALVENFAGQWLQIRNLDLVVPDAKVFPGFTPALRHAMRRETELVVESVIRDDHSVLELLTADYTYANEVLARHYGFKGVQGDGFQKVNLKGTGRQGITTHAGILTLTSHPDRTSPVKRGKWVLDNLLGTPPPPAPPNVPTLEDDGRKLTGTLRQRMEQHRENAVCASCHALMDPIGFGFENFDAIGRHRTRDGQEAIDPSGMLATGEKFAGPGELAGIMAGPKKDLFVRNLVEKMLTYALGRGLEYYDKCAVKKIVREMEAADNRFSALILGVVNSVPFQQQRGEAGAATASAASPDRL